MSVEAVKAAIAQPTEAPPVPPETLGRSRAKGGGGDRPPEETTRDRELARQPRNDIGNGQRLLSRHGEDLLDVAEAGWHVWSGQRWEPSIGQRGGPGPEVLRRAHDTARAISDEADAIGESAPELPLTEDTSPEAIEKRRLHDAILLAATAHRKFGIASGNQGKIEGMLKTAAPYRRRKPEEFDRNPYRLNVLNGTLRLDAEQIDCVPPSRDDLITHLAPVAYDPEASCPQFRKFLDRVQPDADQQRFLQVWGGYGLSGLTVEQVLCIHHGSGSNGKSVMLAILSYIQGDYAATVPIQTFMLDQNQRSAADATPDIARLPGKRLVTASEPEKNARLAESVIKTATGGGKMTARRLFEGQFEFDPAFKLNIDANSKPRISGQDEGIWRRVLLLEWPAFISKKEADKQLIEKLKPEAPGILNWLLDGWRLYREGGLFVTDMVQAATDQYREESEPLRQFVAACLREAPKAFLPSGKLRLVYERWCAKNGFDAMTGNALGRAMTNLGYRRDTIGTVYYLDLELTEHAIELINPPDKSGGTEQSGGDSGPRAPP